MDLSDAIKARIKYYLSLHKMSIWALAKRAGIPISTLTTFMNGKTDLLRVDTILHVCEGLNITLEEFFSDPTFATAKYEKDKE